jgi:uncharacterized membrane protein YedE/YeeE
MKKNLTAILAGLIFGLGLTMSQMIDANVVIGFLNIFGQWDASLLLVLISALTVSFCGFHFAKRLPKPLFSDTFSPVNRQGLDKNLVLGACLFGVGWGLSGLCPGPAIAGIHYNPAENIPFLLAMLAGIKLKKLTLG